MKVHAHSSLKLFLFFCISILLFSCSGEPSQQQTKQSTDSVRQISDTLSDSVALKTPANQFSRENLKVFADSLKAYWKKAGSETNNDYKILVDTIVKADTTEYFCKFKAKGGYSYRFSIFEFKSDSAATEYFNDLKTQEMVIPFGLNKSPNHILVSGNRVYWHYLDHPTGHRMNDYKRIFRNVFQFGPASANLDSVSGFTYCQCFDDDADFSGVAGVSWTSVSNVIEQDTSKWPHYYPRGKPEAFGPESITIKFEKDVVTFDGVRHSIRHKSSKKLPDSFYYVKHAYLQAEPDSVLMPGFKKVLQKAGAYKSALTEYDISINNDLYFTFIKLANGNAYCSFNNRFYTMKKSGK